MFRRKPRDLRRFTVAFGSSPNWPLHKSVTLLAAGYEDAAEKARAEARLHTIQFIREH